MCVRHSASVSYIALHTSHIKGCVKNAFGLGAPMGPSDDDVGACLLRSDDEARAADGAGFCSVLKKACRFSTRFAALFLLL